jgi:exopolyphosphatase/guanosine-5'-triphosphate,3'-diphosphate pyrophosphatase
MENATNSNSRLAAIDVGTNSIRLVVAEVDGDGSYRVLDEEREMTRLGSGLDAHGRLADESMGKSLDAIGKMKAIADGFQVSELRAIATSAVREATNGGAFCREAERRHGVRIEVISANEEARFAFQSAARHFSLDGRSTAVVDIGGGSAEVILAAGTVIDQVHSMPLGAVRLTERCCLSDPLKKKHWKLLLREIDRQIKEQIGKPPFTTEVMVGSGGTFTAVAEVVQSQRLGQTSTVQGYQVSRADVIHLLDRLRETPLQGRRQMPGLNPTRADIIVAGVAVIARLAEHLGCRQILVNDRGIRDGLLVSMIRQRNGERAPAPRSVDRMEAVRAFAAKCRSNERHCGHVARLAVSIFDGLREQFGLPPHGREILEAAALLHEIGYLINHSQHHKHAYHLIMHGELPGFSAHEVEMIANVARYHRRALPKKSHPNFRRLNRADRGLVRRLSGILRVADGLDRTHSGCVTGVACDRGKGTVRMVLDASADPKVEIWDAERKAKLFEKAFGCRLELAWREDVERQTVALHPAVRTA